MEDSTAMTIEFLRARLLSERSVSRSARQRADELAQRVAELEEQLHIVSLQRMRAEKATEDVLAILESNGVSDLSEEFDSNSDQETPSESKVDNGSLKEGESSVNSNLGKKGTEELSGSDLNFSTVPGRSLSWKGRKNASNSPEKRYKDSHARRRGSFSSISFSSPKHRQGKSCRQIRRRESRSIGEMPKTDDVKVDSEEKGLITSSDVNPCQSEKVVLRAGENPADKDLAETLSDVLKDERNTNSSDLDLQGDDGEKNMEKALEHQAQLIGRYEAMERAQTEWEEKFRENNSSTPDSCDPGNHSDVTEERDEIKTQAQYVAETSTSQVQEAEVERDCFSKELPAQSSNFVPPPHSDLNFVQDKRHNSAPATASQGPESHGQDFAFPVANENYDQEHLQSQSLHNFPRSQPPHHHLSNVGSSFDGGEASRRQHDLYAMVPHETSSGYAGVLDALKQARLSLEQKINRSLLVEGESVGKAIQPSIPVTKAVERADIPIGCAGLFRLPTDFPAEASNDNSFLDSGSRLSLANHLPETGVALTAGNQFPPSSYMNTQLSRSYNHLDPGDQFLTSPYMASISGFSTIPPRFLTSPYMASSSNFSTIPLVRATSAYLNGGQLLTSQHVDTGSVMSAQKQSSDPYMDTRLPSSSLHNYPTFPDLMPRTFSREGFPTFHPSRSTGLPDQFPLYDQHFRQDMYR
ncbi:hypothetical protein SLEP1_g42668 [Rubroshorea leprosula]|uniref:Uncharacterized protein n=1 Tax=Rubroshorea leprosula TaxID=152421 RepID=A0AAV5LB58_9ROSI|nr:hypothetical protein SLEP1_g42668 [Rubroshorea leprosula]